MLSCLQAVSALPRALIVATHLLVFKAIRRLSLFNRSQLVAAHTLCLVLQALRLFFRQIAARRKLLTGSLTRVGITLFPLVSATVSKRSQQTTLEISFCAGHNVRNV